MHSMESSSVFLPGEISLLIDKEIGNFLEVFLKKFSANSINFANFLVKIFQIFNMRKMEKKKKKTLESRVSFKDFMM